jgi:hypothetical protein
MNIDVQTRMSCMLLSSRSLDNPYKSELQVRLVTAQRPSTTLTNMLLLLQVA